ncbi:hypothetical protein TNCT_27791 [Trichonephila clavata]|uniref:Uncharacterized protein n=1 Tax=Trichonephila clavata TaxID=2740835 RepID=A0A8X6KQ93_TRICU|nr:hypothetical protein TNCT_27791 [Trichonephila clavata]
MSCLVGKNITLRRRIYRRTGLGMNIPHESKRKSVVQAWFDSFHSSMNACFVGTKVTLPAAYIGRTVTVKPSRMHQNARLWGPAYCYKSFHSSTTVVPCRNEHEVTPPHSVRTGRGKTIPHKSELKIGGSRALFIIFHSPLNVVLLGTNITLPRCLYRSD